MSLYSVNVQIFECTGLFIRFDYLRGVPTTSTLVATYISDKMAFVTADVGRAFQSFQLLRMGSAIVAGILLVHLGFSEVEVGLFEWFLFVTHAASFFWSMGLKNALSTYIARLSSDLLGRLYVNIFVLFSLLGAVIGMLLCIFVESLEAYRYLLAGYFILTVPASLAEHFLILDKKPKTLFWYGLISSVGYLGAVAAGALQGHLSYVFSALLFWALCRFVYVLKLVFDYPLGGLDFTMLRQFVVFGFPLILHILFGAGMDVLDGFLVEAYFGEEQFAQFRYGARELPISLLLVGALVTASLPSLRMGLQEQLPVLKQKLSRYMDLLFPLSLVLLLVSDFLYRTFYSEAYTISADIFDIYLLILVSRILVPQAVLYAKEGNKILMWTALAELLVNLTFSLLLIQYVGLIGIAYATLIAYTFEKVVLCTYVYRAYGIGLSQYIDLRKYLIYAALLIGGYLISHTL